jgi:hypothetical protein
MPATRSNEPRKASTVARPDPNVPRLGRDGQRRALPMSGAGGELRTDQAHRAERAAQPDGHVDLEGVERAGTPGPQRHRYRAVGVEVDVRRHDMHDELVRAGLRRQRSDRRSWQQCQDGKNEKDGTPPN